MSGDIDFGRHGIVEAHAGTGKTYTIVHKIALRVLTEPLIDGTRLHVRNLMLVTYTDKAAGELRSRLREGLEGRLKDCADPDLARHLEDCLKTLGEAWIGTIHATSLRILRMHPFESSMPLRSELVEDEAGLEEALLEVLREDDGPWLRMDPETRERLAVLDMEKLRNWALETAKLLLGAFSIYGVGTETERHDAERAAFQEALGPWTSFLEGMGREFLPRLERIQGGIKIKNLVKKWQGLSRSTPAVTLVDLSSLKDSAPKFDPDKPGEEDAQALWQEMSDEWSAICGPTARRLEDARNLAKLSPEDSLKAEFVGDWSRAAIARWKERKRSQGLVSYADMVSRLRIGLEEPGLREALRARIRVGVIDEFQDTGREPWEIFRRWFEPRPDSLRNGLLFLVGDPKQSIYSFQGADLHSYHRACRELQDAGAGVYVLNRNFRSHAGVIDGVNHLLVSRPAWFAPPLSYDGSTRAIAPERPDPDGKRLEVSGEVRIREGGGNAATARRDWARAVARDIGSRQGSMVRLPRGLEWKPERPLEWGDFAVVVPARSHARTYAEALEERGIPWAFYKQEGVFSTRSAREWKAVLQAVSEAGSSDDRVRIVACTRVFGLAPGEYDPQRHAQGWDSVGESLARWRGLAQRSRWAELLRAISRETGWTDRILSGPEPDRQWMDQRQVRSWILASLRNGSQGLDEVVRRLARLGEGDESEGKDENLLQRATDQHRVQIMTMHASKGLEFPVVYLGGGATTWSRPSPIWSWIEEDGLRVLPGFLEKPNSVKSQQAAESRRLLYVALTRAQVLCGVPLFTKKGKHVDELGKALLERDLDGPGVSRWMDDATESAEPAREAPPRIGRVASLADIEALGLPGRTFRQASFTAVARDQVNHTMEGRSGRSEEEETESVTASWLPRGARTGDALHEIVEAVLEPGADLRWVREDVALPVALANRAAGILSRQGLGKVPVDRVLDLVRHVLRAPLPLGGAAPVRLGWIPESDRRCEVEFFRGCANDGAPLLPGQDPAGWVVGHIDLLFRHEGSWYAVDWKSNDLDSFTPRSLDRSMAEHRYDLQAALYEQAVRDALPGERFGGCAWIFLRGADPSGVPAWIREADPAGGAEATRAVGSWIRKEGRAWTR